jgi:membrane protein
MVDSSRKDSPRKVGRCGGLPGPRNRSTHFAWQKKIWRRTEAVTGCAGVDGRMVHPRRAARGPSSMIPKERACGQGSTTSPATPRLFATIPCCQARLSQIFTKPCGFCRRIFHATLLFNTLRRLPSDNRHLRGVTFANGKDAVSRSLHDLLKNRTLQAAAALSYYSILSIFPALILLSAVMAYIPLPNFFVDALAVMSRVVPLGTMPMVNSVLLGILGADLRAWLSLGTIATLWVVSSAFDEMIDALDTAYDVTDHRPIWKTRLLAVGLALITGLLLMCAIAVLVVGPQAGQWLASRMFLSGLFVFLWPFLHLMIAIGFALLGVQTIYFLAPRVKQRFLATLPGAVLSVVCWIGLSYLLGIYFRYFENVNRIYGTLGGMMALMTWLYWGYFIFLAGGELNAELSKAGHPEQLIGTNAPGHDRAA